MTNALKKIEFLNGNEIKIIACILMVIDHVGFMLVSPSTQAYEILRIIGRLSFPIFAYMFAEGCHYTRNKLKHFLILFFFAAALQIFYYFFDNGSLEMSILVTLLISMILIEEFRFVKLALFSGKYTSYTACFAIAIFIASLCGTYILCDTIYVDYGFFGCILPLLISLFDTKGIPQKSWFRYFDNKYVRMLMMLLGCYLTYYSVALGWIQYLSMFSVLIILFYNGQKGKLKMKYFFYFFYPGQFILLYLIGCLIYGI